jgi:hypothetical protein
LKPNQALPSLAAKRKAASGFIKAVTGQAIPFATDQSFRAALKDGVLLCKLANAVWPGTVKQVGFLCLGRSNWQLNQMQQLCVRLGALCVLAMHTELRCSTLSPS